MEYLLIFIAGVMGSFHCIGMCGAFPVALSSGRQCTTTERSVTHFFYNLGRVFTYVFMGTAFGLFGYVIGEMNFVVSGQVLVSLVAGIFMVVLGFQITGAIRERTIPGFGYFYNIVVRVMSYFLKERSPLGGFYLGVFNGFLPCPLIYAFLFTAAASGSPVNGALIMALLGMGTIPTMFMMGMLSGFLSPVFRARLSRYIPGVIVVLFGVMTIARAFIPLFPDTAHMMHH